MLRETCWGNEHFFAIEEMIGMTMVQTLPDSSMVFMYPDTMTRLRQIVHSQMSALMSGSGHGHRVE